MACDICLVEGQDAMVKTLAILSDDMYVPGLRVPIAT